MKAKPPIWGTIRLLWRMLRYPAIATEAKKTLAATKYWEKEIEDAFAESQEARRELDWPKFFEAKERHQIAVQNHRSWSTRLAGLYQR